MGQKLILSDFVSESSVTGKLNGMSKRFRFTLHEDLRIRKFIDNELKEASVSHVEIERAITVLTLLFTLVKPGMVIVKADQKLKTS